MKIAIALICVAVGYGLCLVDYNSVIEYLQSIPKEDRVLIGTTMYVIVAFITYASLTIFVEKSSDDVWKIFVGLLWLPAIALTTVFGTVYYIDKGLRKLGDKISER